ncbi:MAG: hypothetical protein A2V88_03115 [Elusimicrobia bacterium RBG_16_66_12]|nr:MAG: hypothetical protein A2V88_03115 [Elusimicrobia bacterium RBG_16_66_12]
MNDDLHPVAQPRDMKDRPSRARYDKVKTGLDLKWRRRAPQAERIMREVVDALWDAFGGSPWLRCGLWVVQPDGKAFQPGPARPEPAPAAVPLDGPRGETLSSGLSRNAAEGGEHALYVPILDKNAKTWAVCEVRSPAPFDDMDARWIERLFKIFQSIDRPGLPPLA